MPTYLQDGVGITGGSTLIGGTAASETLSLISTSNATKGKIYLGDTSSASSSAYDEVNNALLIGRKFSLPINSGSGKMFNGSIPKAEFMTGLSAGAYDECVVIRHELVDPTAVTRRVGLLLKIASEIDTNESSKSGGVILQSDNVYGNQPKLSLITNYTERLTILIDGKIGINTLYPSYQLDVNGTARTGALTTTTIAASGLVSANAGLALTVGSDATGDMYYRNSGGQLARIPIASNGTVLTLASGIPHWLAPSGLIGLTTVSPYYNTFLGSDAGNPTPSFITGANNVSIGFRSGYSLTSGGANIFLGDFAGNQTTTGVENIFLGESAGEQNISGGWNILIGTEAGTNNTTGSTNIIIGIGAGYNNTSGSNNIFIGASASTNTVENGNILIGNGADIVAGVTNSVAIGHNAIVGSSSSIVLGNNQFVGIGTSTPQGKLDVNGDIWTQGLIMRGNSSGTLFYCNSIGALTALPIGSVGQTLRVASYGLPVWM